MLEAFINEVYSDIVPDREIGICEGDLRFGETELDSNRLKVERMYIFNLPNKYDFNGEVFYITTVLRLLSGGFSRDYSPSVGNVYINCYIERFKEAVMDRHNGEPALRIDDVIICYEKKIRGHGRFERLNTIEDLKEIIESHLKITMKCDDCGETQLINDPDLPEKHGGFCSKCLLKEKNIKILEDRRREWKESEEKRRKRIEYFIKPLDVPVLPIYGDIKQKGE